MAKIEGRTGVMWWWLWLGLALSWAASSAAAEPLRVHGSDQVLEIAPILIAARNAPDLLTVHNGGVPSLWNSGDPAFPGMAPKAGSAPADLAGNAETQVLRLSVAHPDVRIVMTVTEGLYEIVARRSAGIARVADLKGKKIATIGNTSAAFFLHETLAQAGLSDADVTIVSMNAAECAKALIKRRVDAIAAWEPASERARQALGKDAIHFADPAGYRELYSLSTRTDILADPKRRAQAVALLRGVIAGCKEATASPAKVQEALAPRTKEPLPLIAASWKHHRFSCGLPADLVDVMVREEDWLATKDGRPARPRSVIAGLVDPSLLAEARR